MGAVVYSSNLFRTVQVRVERQQQVLFELNQLAGAAEAVAELVSPTGALSVDCCLEVLELHFNLCTKNLLNDLLGGLKT